MELNVLWIDDMPNEAFMDRAYEKGIVITNKLNVDAGIEEILAPNIPHMTLSFWMQIA